MRPDQNEVEAVVEIQSLLDSWLTSPSTYHTCRYVWTSTVTYQAQAVTERGFYQSSETASQHRNVLKYYDVNEDGHHPV